MAGIYIENMDWLKFSDCCGEGADYLLATGQAIEVPDHGRLIDVDALRDNNSSGIEIYRPEGTILALDIKIIDAAPTVIPAEEGEE